MSVNLENKKHVYSTLFKLAGSTQKNLRANLEAAYHPNAHWRGSHPLNEVEGLDAIADKVWGPLLKAMPDAERRDSLLIGGEFEGRGYVGAVGHLLGTFKKPWLGVAPSNAPMYLRYGEYHQMHEGRIIQSTVILDILDFLRQAGLWPLAPMLGSVEMWPQPITGDGIQLVDNDPAESTASLDQVLGMHDALNTYDDTEDNGREGLLNMYDVECWHPKMMWYGPAGIGASRGLEGFVDIHQLPFRAAFPNRKAAGHYVRFGDGKYAATGGWPSLDAMHSGDNWLGLPATNKKVTMRVMDFYLCHEGLIRENWIPWDIPHLLLQMGYDIHARLREHGVGMVA